MLRRMKRVYVAENPAQAHLVLGLLEDAGIEGVVEGEMLTGVGGAVGFGPTTQPQVFVADGDAVRAAEILRERSPTPERTTPPPIPEPGGDEMPERRGLALFKSFLLAWLLGSLIASAISLLFVPGALLALALVAIVPAALWALARRPRRR
jgi:hypothetical protein